MSDHVSTSSAAGSSSTPSSGSHADTDVMQVLAEVEGQLSRMRAAQRAQDEAMAALTSRSEAVRQSELAIQAARTDQAAREHALEAQRQELVRQQRDLQDRSQQADSHYQRQQSELSEVRQQLQVQRDAQARQTEQLNQKQSELERARHAWEQERAALVQQLNGQQTELDAAMSRLAHDQQAFASEQARISALARECQAQQQEFHQRSQQMTAERQELLKRVNQAESNVGELMESLEQSQNSIETSQRHLQEATTRISALEEDVQRLSGQVESREQDLQEQKDKLAIAGRKLSEFAEVLAEQGPQLERGAAAMAMVDQQHQQIDRLTKQLAEYKLQMDPEESRRKDERIAQLTEALKQARGQTAGGATGVAELEARNAELLLELDRVKLELQNVNLASQELRGQLDQQVSDRSSDSSEVRDAQVAEHKAKVEALTAELDRLQTQLQSQDGQLQERIESVQREHERASQSMQQRIQDLELELEGSREADGEDHQQSAALRERIAELEQELQEALAAAAKGPGRSGSGGGSSSENEELARKLKDKAKKINAVAEHLRRRRERLKRIRVLMHAQSIDGSGSMTAMRALPPVHQSAGPSMDEHAKQLRDLDTQREQLMELKQSLASSEREFVKRWARPRAVVTIGWMVVLAAITATVSWFAADQLFPAKVAAVATVAADARPGQRLSDEDAESWQITHASMVLDKGFQQTLAKRMTDRHMDQYKEPGVIAARVINDLKVDKTEPGRLTFTLAGFDADDAMLFLDVLVSTLQTESNRQVGKRSDGAVTNVLGERSINGTTRFASLRDIPIEDKRFYAAVPIFGIGYVFCLLLILIVYTKLMQAKRVFEHELGDSPTAT